MTGTAPRSGPSSLPGATPSSNRLPRGWRLVALALLAAVGATILAVIVVLYWREAGDSLAYWIAGDRLAHGLQIYAPPEIAFEPFAYHYPPPMAQVLAPVTLVLGPVPYAIAFRAALLLAVWELAGRRMLPTLALIAFVPLAYSLRVENVEILMALAVVLGLGRWPWMFTVLALLKVSPGLGIVYLALRRRWRDALVAAALGAAICVVSFVLAPELWRAWLASITGRSDMVGNSLIPVPYLWRAAAGFVVAIAAGIIGRRTGELLLVVAVTIANPGLSLQGFAVLAAAIPIWFAGPEGLGAAAEARAGSGRRAADDGAAAASDPVVSAR